MVHGATNATIKNSEMYHNGYGIFVNGGGNGHTESAIYQLDAETLPTSGINERLVFELSEGKEVFSITRGLIRALAVILGDGDAEKARVAENAMHHYTSAAHGALAKGLPTFIASLA
jgi:hypothetical protein